MTTPEFPYDLGYVADGLYHADECEIPHCCGDDLGEGEEE